MKELDIYTQVRDRFLRYVKINTASLPNGKEVPTTLCQFDLARLLYQELLEIGASDVWLDEKNCLVYASIPSNIPDWSGKSIGFIAHMDTSPDVSGENVKPWVYKNYDGKDILLNEKENILMTTELYPHLLNYLGQDLVFTDGTTLLGGDDKAAIASLMVMADYLLNYSDTPHGDIKLAFTPDEEVGGLACNLDLARFGADLAYTIDGDYVGYYSYETFNATEAQIKIHGLNVHPGTAKDVMINAVGIASEMINSLPPMERPEHTEGREGYFHPHYFAGNVEEATLFILIRDHDDQTFDKRIATIIDMVDHFREKHGAERIELEFANGYRSMRKVVEPVMYMIDYLKEAITESGVRPTELPFRGGTDGSAISQRGLPCPNISAGYENGHSRFEFVPIQSMEKNVEILVKLCEKFA